MPLWWLCNPGGGEEIGRGWLHIQSKFTLKSETEACDWPRPAGSSPECKPAFPSCLECNYVAWELELTVDSREFSDALCCLILLVNTLLAWIKTGYKPQKTPWFPTVTCNTGIKLTAGSKPLLARFLSNRKRIIHNFLKTQKDLGEIIFSSIFQNYIDIENFHNL